MVDLAHEKTKHVYVGMISNQPLDQSFTDALTIIYTADSRIIYPTFQRFKGRF